MPSTFKTFEVSSSLPTPTFFALKLRVFVTLAHLAPPSPVMSPFLPVSVPVFLFTVSRIACSSRHPLLMFHLARYLQMLQEYLNAMEPLLIEEAREGARSAFGEACEADRGRQVDIMRCCCCKDPCAGLNPCCSPLPAAPARSLKRQTDYARLLSWLRCHTVMQHVDR